jgi:hypothetical protein
MAKKLNEGAQITNEKNSSEVMKARYTHGDEWQSYIADKFEGAGIPPVFYTINDGLSDRIADYQYEGNWIEAKTFINSAEVTKILTLYSTLESMKIRMVVMCEWEPGFKKHAKNVADLRRFGVIVFEGQSECDSFIINESILLNPNKVIKMAEPILIPFDNLLPHPNNRDLNVKNIPTIKASIINNGFFTQINVVPHQLNDNGEMTYMIFEGHTRYYSLLDLKQKGYVIPPVACINVHWVTSQDIDRLHKMLITTNTTYAGWKLKNFITSHKGNLELLNDIAGVYTYGKMLQAMNQAKKQGWGEANPIYMFCHTDSLAFDDMKKVKDGDYRITENEYDSQIKPILDFMKKLTSDKRKFNGTIMRDIIVDIRIMYNTNPSVKDRFHQFLPWLAMKFIGDYSIDKFPITKESGQQYWSVIKREYLFMIDNGMIPVQPIVPEKTIMDFA